MKQRTLYNSEPFLFKTSVGPNFYGALNFNITGYKHKQAKHLTWGYRLSCFWDSNSKLLCWCCSQTRQKENIFSELRKLKICTLYFIQTTVSNLESHRKLLRGYDQLNETSVQGSQVEVLSNWGMTMNPTLLCSQVWSQRPTNVKHLANDLQWK